MAFITFRFTAWVCAAGRVDRNTNKTRLRTTSEGKLLPVTIHIIYIVLTLLFWGTQQARLDAQGDEVAGTRGLFKDYREKSQQAT